MKKLLLSAITLFLFFAGCKKKEDLIINQNSSIIEGKIILPSPSPFELKNLVVQSFIDEYKVFDNNFKIKTNKNETNILFVKDISNKIILMGYIYPGQTNFDISPKSTALAIIMNSPLILSLTKEAKLDLINEMVKDEKFAILVSKIEEIISNGLSPLDATKTQIYIDFATYFDTQFNRRISKDKEIPIGFVRIFDQIRMQNFSRAYYTTVGVYKDCEIFDTIFIPNIIFLPKGVGVAIKTATGEELPISVYQPWVIDTLDELGQFNYKLRTGVKSVLEDDSPENIIARKKNLTNFTFQIINAIIPYSISDIHDDCKKDVFDNINLLADNLSLIELENYSPDSIIDVYNFIVLFFNKEIAEKKTCLTKYSTFIDYYNSINEFITWHRGLLNNVTETYIYTSLGTNQLQRDTSSIDYCYTVIDVATRSISENCIQCKDYDGNFIQIDNNVIRSTLDLNDGDSYYNEIITDEGYELCNGQNSYGVGIINYYSTIDGEENNRDYAISMFFGSKPLAGKVFTTVSDSIMFQTGTCWSLQPNQCYLELSIDEDLPNVNTDVVVSADNKGTVIIYESNGKLKFTLKDILGRDPDGTETHMLQGRVVIPK
jgi:hypothetical protein